MPVIRAEIKICVRRCRLTVLARCQPGHRMEAGCWEGLAMDEDDLKSYERKFLGPARVVSLKDHLLSCEWRCSSCGLTVDDIVPFRCQLLPEVQRDCLRSG